MYYSLYGKLLGGSKVQPYGFSTKRSDFESGLVYYGYRFYLPHLSRWLNRDPIGENGGVNVYAFVEGNPVGYADPNGLKTYVCKRPLKGVPFTMPIINHTYACVTRKDGKIVCSSTTAGSESALDNIWPNAGSPGKATSEADDYYDPKRCEEEVEDDTCVESCIQSEWKGKRPWYSIGPNGTDCQEYTSYVINKCENLCQRK